MQLLRSRSFAVFVHVVLWLLLFLCLRNLGGNAPEFRDATSAFLPAQALAPVAKLEILFAAPTTLTPVTSTNTQDLFMTRYFVPAPTPAPPPPPTVKKIPVIYQGFYEPAGAPKKAILKMADGFLILPVGAAVVTNIFVADPGMQLLVLTNQAGQTNLLPLNVQKELEVPVK